MKLKEIERTAHQAWSPAEQHPIYLAAGTSAQQLDATFSTNAALEIFELDLSDPGFEMKLRGSIKTANRYHKILWSSHGLDSGGAGTLIGGGDGGLIVLYDAARILAGDMEAELGQSERHTGPVRALDINPFQNNLLASGANDSEIYIWDLNNFATPMTPGARSQPLEDVGCVAWNCQVQHILASATPSGKAVVWDLRKNEPIIKVSDHTNRMRCSGIAWHPDVATQLVLASEDDRMPVIQMWDLRFATSPLRVFENHARGILTIAWSRADPELLLSCAKDNRILCWNPNTGEVVYELPTSTQWCFDIQWCPRNPALISAASFDGRLSIYSVMGGSLSAQSQSQVDMISSSFGNLDPFGTGQPLPPLQLPQPQVPAVAVLPLKKPPRWIRRPVGASFAFGGRLVTFGRDQSSLQQHQQSTAGYPAQGSTPGGLAQSHYVFVSQVVTEPLLLRRSAELQAAEHTGHLRDFCHAKVQASVDPLEKEIWSFLQVNLEPDPRSKFLKLIGYNPDELAKEISAAQSVTSVGNGTNMAETTQKEASEEGLFNETSTSKDDADEPAVIAPERLALEIPVSSDVDGLIGQSLLVGDFEAAVELCLGDCRYADAIILAVAGGAELLERTQERYFDKSSGIVSRLISKVVSRDWYTIINTCKLDSWKEALAVVLTYTKPEEFSELCNALGSRLEMEDGGRLCAQACLCYICAGNVDKLASCWNGTHKSPDSLALQDLVEKVIILQKSLEFLYGSGGVVEGFSMAEKLARYAGLLAAQGQLSAAMDYLPETLNEPSILELRDRLFHAQGEAVAGQPTPPFPFPHFEVSRRKTYQAGSTHPAQQERPNMYQLPRNVGPTPMQQPPFPSTPQGSTMPTPPPANFFIPQPPAAAHPPSIPPVQSGVNMYSRGATIGYSHQSNMPAFSQPANIPQGTMAYPLAPASILPSSATSGYPGLNLQGFSPSPFPTNNPPPTSLSGPQVFTPGAPVPCCPPPTGLRDGWNDPPSLHPGKRRNKLPSNFTPPAPFMTPLPMESQSLQAQSRVPHEPSQTPPGAPAEPFMQPAQVQPPAKIEKRPIPEEHASLRVAFDGLVQRCLSAASDPQTKRKLDDANKRLEFLYDILREHSLSANILAGLHEIAHRAESREYAQGLAVHMQVVSSSNFSEISTFMPVLKVVMTIAGKLHV
uniref:protein transport protein Sec31A isoform X2 n=1 Tax=Myxine glutinosa TaxID=7769 RepID=UPI00358F4E5C